MKLADIPEVGTLAIAEKIQLLEELYQNIAQELDSMEVPQEHKTLLDDRWNAFLRDPSSALTLEQFKSKLNALRS